MKGSSSATTPSETGSSVLAAAWAIGAEPWPASFENSPRRTPHIRVTRKAPTPVPAIPAEGLKASWKISMKEGMISPAFARMMKRAPRT